MVADNNARKDDVIGEARPIGFGQKITRIRVSCGQESLEGRCGSMQRQG